MKHFTLDQKYELIKKACWDEVIQKYSHIGISDFPVLHDIADNLEMKGNSGRNLRSLSARINKIMRDLIAAGYPIDEGRIKCVSWSNKESWHPIFTILETERPN